MLIISLNTIGRIRHKNTRIISIDGGGGELSYTTDTE